MNALDTLLTAVLQRAIRELKKADADIYTFAFHHDQQRDAVSVYADTAANSRRIVREMNRSSMKHFADAVRKRDLDEALLWQASVGRNLSLADFSWTRLARRSLGKLKRSPALHAAMLRAAIKCSTEVVELSSDRDALLFTCSTPDEEIGLIWTADAAKRSPAKRKALKS